MTAPKFTTAQLLDTTAEVVDILRGTLSRGQLWDAGCDAADQEFVALAFVAVRCGLSLEGIPTWRQAGRIRGLSTSTRLVEIQWIVSDVKERLSYKDPVAHEALWIARRHSIGVSRDVRSLMVGMWAETFDDEFAEFRSQGLAG